MKGLSFFECMACAINLQAIKDDSSVSDTNVLFTTNLVKLAEIESTEIAEIEASSQD